MPNRSLAVDEAASGQPADRAAPQGSEFPPPAPFGARLADALRRRARSAWRQCTLRSSSPAAETAFAWLESQAAGVPAAERESPCPTATGAALETATACGADDLAARWRHWLLSVQSSAGGFAAAASSPAANLATAYALRGLLAAEPTLPGAASRRAIARAADALSLQLAGFSSSAEALVALPPLLRAARLCELPRVERLAVETFQRIRRAPDLVRWEAPLEVHAATLDALLDLRDLADDAPMNRLLDHLLDDALSHAAALQRRDGSLPNAPGAPRISPAGIAKLALVWLRRGDLQRGGRALDFVAARRPTAWTAIWFLQAARLRVAASFAAADAPPLVAIDPCDGRWLAAETMLSELPADACVADVGCGVGRYLLRIQSRFPHLRLVGIDPAAAALAALPAGIATRVGDLPRLPAGDGEFDAAVCVEALEHALLPRRAVAELCRIVRPGGRLLIVDKNSARQSLSRHEPWERWFAAEEVSAWLAEHCRDVAARHIPHGVPPRDPRLFLAWTGEKKIGGGGPH